MAVSNSEIAAVFERIADLLEIQGDNPFRIRAYRNAARTVQGLSRSLADMVAKDEALEELPTIGKDLAAKIREIVKTGSLRKLSQLESSVSPGMVNLLKVPGLGPKRLRKLRDYLNVHDLDTLEKAARQGRLRQVPGFGAKTEKNILRELQDLQLRTRRFLWAEVEDLAEQLVAYLRRQPGVKQVEMAGSYRRRRETVGDLDILVSASRGSGIMDAFIGFAAVERVISRGSTRSTVVLRTGLQVDLRVVPQVSFGAAWHYFTGSKAHNIAVRVMGIQRGWKVNEYGIFDKEGQRIAGRTEKEIYSLMGMEWIPPELREKRGELEAAAEGRLPRLIVEEDLRGDLHCHTTRSDGQDSLEAMARAARDLGHDYLAITEHSQHLRVAGGLTADELLAHCDAIDALNERMKGIRLLKGLEVDILEDGSLDMPDQVLQRLDICLGAIHSGFSLAADQQTERVIRAMDHPAFNVLAHPTARLMGRRAACALDMERIMDAALERGCYLELNAQPRRLDLNDVYCRMAKERGLKVALSTDAHSTGQLSYQRYGVAQARRGWLEKKDVLNTADLKHLLRALRR
ncbi:DNA polymerase/3'-5' exonuclease PolX [Thiolapillus brandeum]|uniref:DNA polymerase beta n=1 Tax=Thiolapillus brandeum TaxID=1076588 RepID=A0A7U6JGH0_9GAMM|nr:DNA polymerase/3'-5' exonuclease PolX [Thiolapillus brandeum]BAO43599.1 DNA polymerase IV family X [Thiolapillus brandeum]